MPFSSIRMDPLLDVRGFAEKSAAWPRVKLYEPSTKTETDRPAMLTGPNLMALLPLNDTRHPRHSLRPRRHLSHCVTILSTSSLPTQYAIPSRRSSSLTAITLSRAVPQFHVSGKLTSPPLVAGFLRILVREQGILSPVRRSFVQRA